MNLQDSTLGKAAVIDISGRLDAAASPLFDAHCSKLVGQGQTVFVLDLSDVEYLSSAGLRSILGLTKSVKPKGGKVIIVGVKGGAKEIFDIAGFSAMFPMFDTIEAAASSVL